MATGVCIDCGSAFQRRAAESWRRVCSDCWRRGARPAAPSLHVHRCVGGRECDARSVLRELALRVPVLLAVIEAAPASMERESAATFLRVLVQRVAELEGGR